LPGVADPDPLDLPLPVDEDADLPADLSRDLGELAGELLGDERARREPPLIELLESAPLLGLQTAGIAFELMNGWTSTSWRR
jgi:hypothetical protein